MTESKRIRVLIVDDSALMRNALKDILEQDRDIEVIGMARDGKEGVEKAMALKPDVITMDLRMPVMSGFDAIQNIMIEIPIPIIVVTSMDVNIVVKALSIGAMDFVAVTGDIDTISADLISKVRIASRVKALKRFSLKPNIDKPARVASCLRPCKLIAIGVSTGGPQSLHDIFPKLPKDFRAGIIVVQHMSKGFIEGLAEWLNTTSALHVSVAKAGDTVCEGTILLAPDSYHTTVDENGVVRLRENTDKAVIHVPSIDVMMRSVAESFGQDAIGVIMTGMGHDGVDGIKTIKKFGGKTIAQDEHSSVVFGMNAAAIDSKAVDEVLALERIAERLSQIV